MKPNGNSLLLQLLRNPSEMVSLSLQQWDIIIPLARQTRGLGVFAHQAIEQGLVGNIPEPVRPHLVAENRLTLRQEQMVRWEVDRITDALSDVETPIVFLKGAAYCLLDLPSAKGRLFSDTDLLIHKSALDDAETALKNNGWREKEKIDQLNSRYFRQWLHELPPLQHKERMTEIDVHHPLEVSDRLLGGRRCKVDAGVVDDHVDRAVCIDDGVRPGKDGVSVGHVKGSRSHLDAVPLAQADGLGEPNTVEVSERQVGTA